MTHKYERRLNNPTVARFCCSTHKWSNIIITIMKDSTSLRARVRNLPRHTYITRVRDMIVSPCFVAAALMIGVVVVFLSGGQSLIFIPPCQRIL